MPVSTKTPSSSKSKSKPTAKAPSKAPAKATAAKAKSAVKASVKSVAPQEVVEVKAASKKATAAATATATKAASKAKTKVSEPAKVESKSADKTKSKAKSAAKSSVKSAEPQEVVEVKAASKKAPAKAAATKVASKAKAKASEPAKAADKAAAKAGAKTKAKVVAKGYEVYAEPSEGVEAEFKDITLLNKEERYELMRLLQEQNPNPKSELEFKNTFELLCAVVLSAQATDASVNKATPALFKAAPDPKSMAKLGAEGIAPYIQSIGLWKNKAKFLAQLSQALLDKHDGKVPGSFDELVALPGVGSKTAKVVLNVAFGQPFIAVDTHVYRVATRTGLCLGKCPGQVEERISTLVAEPFLKEAHHYLLLHGRYNCTAQRFEGHCDKCVVAKYCKHNYERKEK